MQILLLNSKLLLVVAESMCLGQFVFCTRRAISKETHGEVRMLKKSFPRVMTSGVKDVSDPKRLLSDAALVFGCLDEMADKASD